MIPHVPAIRNADAGRATIALEVLRKGPSLPAPIQFVRGVDYQEIPPAYVVDAASKRGRSDGRP